MATGNALGPRSAKRPYGLSWTGLIGLGLRGLVRRRASLLCQDKWWARNARRMQLAQLRALLARAAGTEIGRRCGFRRLSSLPDELLARSYRRAIPLADYEHCRQMLERMKDGGEPDIAWPGVVRDWVQTSGTTSGQKYIPVTPEMMRSNVRAAIDIFAHAHRFGCSLPRLLSGKSLFLGGSTSLTVTPAGTRVGDLSGLATAQIRWPLAATYLPGQEIALMDDWPAKIDAMAVHCLRQDVRMVSGMASWSLVLFERILDLARKGPPPLRYAKCLRDIWPNLTLFVHGGVKYAPFDPRVRQAWSAEEADDIAVRLEVYPASEGFIAVQDRRDDPGLRLHTDNGVFFEFVPLEEIDRPDAKAFLCDEVERGQRYVVVMSTNAGLWRYIIGDVVEFDTIPGEGRGAGPPRLRIVGRHRHFINAFGENLIVEDIERAVVSARDASGLPVGEFSAAPVYPGPGRRSGVELIFEIDDGACDPGRFQQFALEFDKALRRGSVDYDTKRTGDLGMGPPTISPVPPGTFHRWMAQRGRLGGQNKTPRCANHREYVEAILALNERVAESVHS